MIKAQDLRLGNWVLFDVEEVYEQITPRRIGFISQANSKGHNHPFKPIPLTEEILLKCGFDKVREYFTIYNEFDVFKDNKGYYTHINCGNIYLNSLHQLQNLFYTLTGEELQINL